MHTQKFLIHVSLQELAQFPYLVGWLPEREEVGNPVFHSRHADTVQDSGRTRLWRHFIHSSISPIHTTHTLTDSFIHTGILYTVKTKKLEIDNKTIPSAFVVTFQVDVKHEAEL